MNIDTKFNLGDVVWHVFDKSVPRLDACGKCNGSGKVAALMPGESVLVDCPRCHGRGEQPSDGGYFLDPTVQGPYTIGKVAVEIIGDTQGALGYRHYEVDMHSMGPRHGSRREWYMAIETGVGSGSNYSAENLFASHEEAVSEAERRRHGSIDLREVEQV